MGGACSRYRLVVVLEAREQRGTEQAGMAVTMVTYIREMLSSNLGQDMCSTD
jgi:hypothetical protein